MGDIQIILEGNREVWRGTEEELSKTPFFQLRIDGSYWICKPVNTRNGSLHKPLALDLVNKALRLNCTTGFKQAIICREGKPVKPLPLEGAVPPLGGFPEMGCKIGVIFDIVENRPVTAAASLRDFHVAKEFSRLESVSNGAIQRVALLIIISRCGCINNDDILVRTGRRGDLELVNGDVKKVGWYQWGSHASRRSGPLDEMKTVFDRMSWMMTESDEYDDELDENRDDQCENTRLWRRWEYRPMADTFADLVSSWTADEIDAAVNAWETAVKTTGKLFSSITGLEYYSQCGEDWTTGCKDHYKKQLGHMQDKVRKGERPSLSDINLMFARPAEDK